MLLTDKTKQNKKKREKKKKGRNLGSNFDPSKEFKKPHQHLIDFREGRISPANDSVLSALYAVQSIHWKCCQE